MRKNVVKKKCKKTGFSFSTLYFIFRKWTKINVQKSFKKKSFKKRRSFHFFLISIHPRKSQFLFSTLQKTHFWMVLLHHFWFFLHPRFEKTNSETMFALKKIKCAFSTLPFMHWVVLHPPPIQKIQKVNFFPIFPIFRLWSQPHIYDFLSY